MLAVVTLPWPWPLVSAMPIVVSALLRSISTGLAMALSAVILVGTTEPDTTTRPWSTVSAGVTVSSSIVVTW